MSDRKLAKPGVHLTHRVDNPTDQSRYADMGVTVFLGMLGTGGEASTPNALHRIDPPMPYGSLNQLMR